MVWDEENESYADELLLLKTHWNAMIKYTLRLENPAGKSLISVEMLSLLMPVDLFWHNMAMTRGVAVSFSW